MIVDKRTITKYSVWSSFSWWSFSSRSLQSPSIAGLYPAGEGAGYAGGILSAGVDGIKVGEAVARAILSSHSAKA